MRGLQRLYQFVAVAEELHFGRAAKRLHMTQPPLSMQIRSLEEDIGAVLLHRTKRQVELTEAGQILYHEARRALDQIDRAVSLTQRAGRGEIGNLRIAFVSTADYSLMPPLLREFKQRRPEVELSLKELTTDAQMRAFENGELDIGFVVTPVDNPKLETEVVFREPLIVALPESSALSRKRGAVHLKELADEGLISFPRATAPVHYDEIQSYFRATGFTPRVAQTAVQMQTIISLVSANLGVALVPACMRSLKRDGVAYRELKPQPPIFETAITWPRRPLSGVAAAFVDLTREVVETTWRPSID